MPKDELIAVLGRGAAVWNEWRAKHDETPELSRAGLRGLDLSGFDLTGAFLDGVQFLNCAQLTVARNWQLAFRDETLGCGAPIPDRVP